VDSIFRANGRTGLSHCDIGLLEQYRGGRGRIGARHPASPSARDRSNHLAPRLACAPGRIERFAGRVSHKSYPLFAQRVMNFRKPGA